MNTSITPLASPKPSTLPAPAARRMRHGNRAVSTILLLGTTLAISSAIGGNTVELTRVGSWPGYQRNLIWRLQVAGNTVFGADGEGLVVFDVADPEHPTLVTRHALPGAPTEFRYQDGALFVCLGEAGLAIVDVSNTAAPQTLSVHPVEGGARDLEVNGNVAFVQTGLESALTDGFIEAVNVQDRSKPSTLSRFGFGVLPGLSAEGGWLCVARWKGMELFDVTDPANPQSVTTFDTPGYAHDVVLSGGYAYVADDYLGFTIIDLRDPLNPILVANLGESYAQQIEVEDLRAFVYGEASGRVAVYDISVPSNPSRLAILGDVQRPLTVAGNIGFSAYRGLIVYNIADPVRTSRIGIYPLGCVPSQVAVRGNTAFVANGDYYCVQRAPLCNSLRQGGDPASDGAAAVADGTIWRCHSPYMEKRARLGFAEESRVGV